MLQNTLSFLAGCLIAGGAAMAWHYRELSQTEPTDWPQVWAKVEQKAAEKAEAKATEHAARAKSEAIAESGKRIDEVLGLARSHGAIIDKLEQSIDDNVAMLREKWGNDLKTLNGRITELARPPISQQSASPQPAPIRQPVPVAPLVRVSPPAVQVQQSSGGGGYVERDPIIISQSNNQQVIQQQNPVTIREERRPPQDFFAPAPSRRPAPQAEPAPLIPEQTRQEVRERVEAAVEQAAPQIREKLDGALDKLRGRLGR